jgi:gluconolactonase
LILGVLLAGAAWAQTDYPNLGMTPPPASFPVLGRVIRSDPALDRVLAAGASIEVLASGFDWSEGPAWDRQGGYLLFSDIPRNTIWKWAPAQGITLFLKPSGYTGTGAYSREPGSNGLVFDAQGRLLAMEHGDRRVSRMDRDGGKITLADRYEGKRLNSPNDGVLDSNGDLYFTDPPYGLPRQASDPRRELDFCGVYRYGRDGSLTLLTRELSRPNGIAFSPDEKTLYVANSDPRRAVWMAFPVTAGGTLGAGRVFADVTSMVGQHKGLPDGLKVDREGNLWATGPGGVHIYSPQGKLLGRLETLEATANCAWGDDGSTLYITADMYLCRIRTQTRGMGW